MGGRLGTSSPLGGGERRTTAAQAHRGGRGGEGRPAGDETTMGAVAVCAFPRQPGPPETAVPKVTVAPTGPRESSAVVATL